MYLKSLTISGENGVIRKIDFHDGLNLIVDESQALITGNNVGKTTVLKLIDFCLGSKPNNIWVDPETKKDEYVLVKNFLKENKVLITLILKENLNIIEAKEIKIERNFLNRKELIRNIDGVPFTEEEFDMELSKIILPTLINDKPTFRQVISHNIRYKDLSINNTLKTLDGFTTDAEYETLHLYMLGVEFSQGSTKQSVLAKLKQEETFKQRLEKNQTKNTYEFALSLINNDIEALNQQKSNFNLNENFESDLDSLTNIKYKLNSSSSEKANLNIRKELILETQQELEKSSFNVDLQQLQIIYEQATHFSTGIQKTFEDLVAYHNKMINEKVKFVTEELPGIENAILKQTEYIYSLLEQEKQLTNIITKSDSFEELEKLIGDLNEKYRTKGEYENIVQQLNDVEMQIKTLNIELDEIESELFSDTFEQKVKQQLIKFNKLFASVSNYLYGEQYALRYEISENNKGQKLYKFNSFNVNFSSGKKQGEISCFDIAYILFADEENIPCLHFILNDKKELMHNNQLVKIGKVVNSKKIQFVASILRDKLPPELNKEEYIVLKLSQEDKLFRIE